MWWWLWDRVYMGQALLHSTVKMTVLPLCLIKNRMHGYCCRYLPTYLSR